MANFEKKLEILLLRKNESDNQVDIFEEISNNINKKFNVLREDIIAPQETDYYFECEDNEEKILITINKRTYKDKILLFAALLMHHEMEDKPFYELKILLKNTLRPLSEKVYWIYDEQNEKQSQELYQLTNKAENSFRVLIVHFMTFKYGLDWWEHISKKIKKEDRIEGYQRVLTDLKDISLDMYSLDIKDLTRLVESEYTFDVNFTIDIKNHYELTTDKEIVRKTLRKTLKELIDKPFEYDLKSEKGFWKNELSAFFNDPENFKSKWDRLSNDRNHIAHNKIIDLNMYTIMKRNSEYVISELEEAIINVSRSEVTQEEADFRETMHQVMVEETKIRDVEGTGVGILTSKQIEDVFLEYLQENILLPADDMLYFCEALQSYTIEETPDITNPQKIIEVIGYHEESLTLSILNCHIDEDEGGESELTLQFEIDSKSEEFTLTYKNTTVILNEDNVYMIETEGELNSYDLEKDVDKEQGNDNMIIFRLEQLINEQPSNRALENMEND
ncbi:hypothetical protein CFK37_03725 [Virgibacillus phasianinus]|uniref:Apea-like HEPN domain-containing protein n=1 Tax=Virgibacillus phasianinus TaxID=2017483 RepID=A0A220U0B3_9BACI|nr:hypothetical protein [Virgibacillus phasianinus]ASK61343.1 hypothetical protein CFK37_03725 [Virgibacillus phasianinus]